MRKLILVSLGFMGWAFYEASGGDDFAPASAAPASIQTAVLDPTPTTQTIQADLGAVNSTTLSAELKAIAQKAAADAVAEVVLASFSAQQTQAVVTKETPAVDLRQVTGSRVNMRNGPGTSFPVLTQLVKGDQMAVLSDPGEGWLRVRTEDGDVGWMAASLVSGPLN